MEFETVDPGLVGRSAWECEQTQRDVELMAWVGRFRFVTARAIGERFGVSWQQANARVRRLERQRLLGFERQHVSQARAVYLTARGHELLGWPRRRAPRAHVHREHEKAIVRLVTELERRYPDARVLTERECRQLQAGDERRRYCVELRRGSYRDRRRWPDAVVETPAGREVYEIEFAPKGTDRLRGIVEAYELSSYDRATFMVKSAALGRRIKRVRSRTPALGSVERRDVSVVPWIDLAEEDYRSVAKALAK